jgi:hypothetical protein
MRFFIRPRVLAVLAVVLVSAGIVRADTSFTVPPIAAGIMLPDNQTFVVSVPTKGMLIYFDTLADKETKRIDVDFQPAFLAAQGKKLFASAKGAATVYALDAETGKELKTIKVPGEPVSALACHPSKGYLYSVNTNNEVYSIDTEKAEATKTAAKGQLIAVDPNDGTLVYTGIQKPIRDQLVFRERAGKEVTVTFEQANLRALMLKYKADAKELKLEAANNNAAVNGKAMAVSGDGKQIAMAGGGGWRSTTDPKANYAIAAFDTSDMSSLLGQIETGAYPDGIAFHPVLRLGAAYHTGLAEEILVFNTKSYVTKDTLAFKKKAIRTGPSGPILTFCGQGTKVIIATIPLVLPKGIPAEKGEGQTEMQFIPLTLTDADKEQLKKAYEKR